MASSVGISLSFLVLALLIPTTVSQSCKSQTVSSDKTYPQCLDLPQLEAFLHFSYDASNTTLAVVFSAKPSHPGGWIAWAINPTSTGMIGAQTLVAYKDPDNGVAVVKTLNISSYNTLNQSQLAFDVWDMKAEEAAAMDGGTLRIFAWIKVPADLAANGKVNQVWQVGSDLGPGGMIVSHAFDPSNLVSKGPLFLNGDNSCGVLSGDGTGSSMVYYRNYHWISNAVSWGILFPLGAIIASYLNSDLAFSLHVSCQCFACIVDIVGSITLIINPGRQSKGVRFTGHRNMGFALLALTTLQMLAWGLRPKEEHRNRPYRWKICHLIVGFLSFILGITNCFIGFSILNPRDLYKTYIAVIACLAIIALPLEVYNWVKSTIG